MRILWVLLSMQHLQHPKIQEQLRPNPLRQVQQYSMGQQLWQYNLWWQVRQYNPWRQQLNPRAGGPESPGPNPATSEWIQIQIQIQRGV